MSSPTTATTAAALLKELLTLPPVRVLNDTSYLHDTLTKETAQLDASGKYTRYPVLLRRALGRGSRADGGTLPGAVPEVWEDAKVYMRQHYYALEWTEVIEEASKNKEGSFEKVVTEKMKNVAIDMAVELNRQWYNAANGALANCTNTAAGLTITVDDAQFIQIGDLVDIVESNGTAITNGTARTVQDVARDTNVVTLDTAGGNVDPSGDEIVVLSGNYGNEIEGLRHIADDDRTLHNISGTTYDNWDGHVLPANDGVIGESLIERLHDKVGRQGRGNVDFAITTRGIRRRLADEYASQRRVLMEKAADLKLGYRTVVVNDVDTVIDDHAPRQHFFVGKKDKLKVLKMTDPGFIETEAGDGAYITLKNSTTAGEKKAIWQTWYRYHCTLVCTDPGMFGKIADGEDDTDY